MSAGTLPASTVTVISLRMLSNRTLRSMFLVAFLNTFAMLWNSVSYFHPPFFDS
jgi:hypothetical protein